MDELDIIDASLSFEKYMQDRSSASASEEKDSDRIMELMSFVFANSVYSESKKSTSIFDFADAADSEEHPTSLKVVDEDKGCAFPKITVSKHWRIILPFTAIFSYALYCIEFALLANICVIAAVSILLSSIHITREN